MDRKWLSCVCVASWIFSGCSSHMALLTQKQNLLSPQEYMTLGNIYETQGDMPLAARQYQAALDQDKKYVPALVALGNIAYEQKEWRKARKYFKRALKVSPQDPALLNNLAMVYLAEGKNLKGLDEKVKKALVRGGPATPYLWDTLAQISIQQKQFPEAENAIQQASATAPHSDPTFQKRLEETRDQLTAASRQN